MKTNPVHVRYAWQNNPVDASLFNVARLPLVPFEWIRDGE